MSVRRTGDWQRAALLLKAAPKHLERATGLALRQEAERLRSEVVEGLTRQAPGGKPLAPLSDFTLAKRRLGKFSGTKALLRHADLRNAITALVRRGEAFVGVPRKARGRDGAQLADVAKLNEFGGDPIVIPITPKMRRFLFVLRREVSGGDSNSHDSGAQGSGVIVTRIPARPFLRPVFENFQKEASRRFLGRVAKHLNLGG
jgi:hypothetical protein